MSERYVAEKVGIIDNLGEREGICVTDTVHTVSFEVKDEYVAMELCDLLNKLYEENEQLRQGFNELLAVHTKIMQTLDDEFVSKALLDNGDGV